MGAEEPVVRARRRAPERPSAKEVEDHEAFHEPYRSWCRACVAGRGTTHDAHRAPDGVAEVPTVGLDYGYLGDDQDAQPILYGRDDRDKWLYGMAMPAKGSSGDYAWRAPMAALSRSGFTKFVMRTDGEPALVAHKKAIIKALKDAHGIEVVPETTSRDESQSNGLAESAVKQGKAKARTLYQSLCDNLGWKVPFNHCSLAWLPSFAANTVNIARASEDGRTPFRSRHGRNWTKPVPQFGEAVLYSRIGRHASRWEPRAQPGIFLDIDFEKNSYWIGTKSGVVRAATYHRHPKGSQFDLELFKEITGTPWEPSPLASRAPRPISVAPVAAVAEAGARVAQRRRAGRSGATGRCQSATGRAAGGRCSGGRSSRTDCAAARSLRGLPSRNSGPVGAGGRRRADGRPCGTA